MFDVRMSKTHVNVNQTFLNRFHRLIEICNCVAVISKVLLEKYNNDYKINIPSSIKIDITSNCIS